MYFLKAMVIFFKKYHNELTSIKPYLKEISLPTPGSFYENG